MLQEELLQREDAIISNTVENQDTLWYLKKQGGMAALWEWQMARLSRVESQARTRERLLAAAQELFRGQGYAVTSVDQIAEAAGYSKGAVYSNFDGKDAIFLAVLETQGQEILQDLLSGIASAPDVFAIVELLVAWADHCSSSGNWALTILEHARLSPGAPSVHRQEEILRGYWRQLGDCLLQRFPGMRCPSETLGALLHEIAFAPAMTLVASPKAGDLMRLVVIGILHGASLG